MNNTWISRSPEFRVPIQANSDAPPCAQHPSPTTRRDFLRACALAGAGLALFDHLGTVILSSCAMGESPSDMSETEKGIPGLHCELNPQCTFGSFVVGSTNRLARDAAFAVSEAAGTYNPLFIHGGGGLGKTHLMHAIGNRIVARRSGERVVYVPVKRCSAKCGDAMNIRSPELRKRCRRADVLLIDDIQALAGEEGAQEEFLDTFNVLFLSHKQIVISSDRPPSEITNVEPALVRRLEWGLTVELLPPDAKTRMAILRSRSASLGFKAHDESSDS